MHRLTPQAICTDVLKDRYLQPGEHSADDVFHRVARALASVEREEDRLRFEALFLESLRFGAIGAGSIMASAGTPSGNTLTNWFVQPVGDAIEGLDGDGYPGMVEALRQAIETMRCGGGVRYDFSRVRPRGSRADSTTSLDWGAFPLHEHLDHACAAVQSSRGRRGAQMAVLRIDHPDVLEFVDAKRMPGRWTTFNVSVGVTDDFMHALRDNRPWRLVHQAEPGDDLQRRGARQRSDGC